MPNLHAIEQRTRMRFRVRRHNLGEAIVLVLVSIAGERTECFELRDGLDPHANPVAVPAPPAFDGECDARTDQEQQPAHDQREREHPVAAGIRTVQKQSQRQRQCVLLRVVDLGQTTQPSNDSRCEQAVADQSVVQQREAAACELATLEVCQQSASVSRSRDRWVRGSATKSAARPGSLVESIALIWSRNRRSAIVCNTRMADSGHHTDVSAR
jgi:hypothetical protein